MATELGHARVPNSHVRKSGKPDVRYKSGHDDERPSVIARVLSGSGACRFICSHNPGERSAERRINNRSAPRGRCGDIRHAGGVRPLYRQRTTQRTHTPFGAPPRRFLASEPCEFGRTGLRPTGFRPPLAGRVLHQRRSPVVGMIGYRGLPEMACETIRRRRTRSTNKTPHDGAPG